MQLVDGCCSVSVNYDPSLDAARPPPTDASISPGRIRQPSGRHRFPDPRRAEAGRRTDVGLSDNREK